MRPGFFLREAWRSIRANAAISAAATVTVMIAVFILGAFIPSYLYVQSTVDNQKDKLDLKVFISKDATAQQLQGVSNRLVALENEGLVKDFTYLTADQALAEAKSQVKDPHIYDLVPPGTIPATFKVHPTDPSKNAQIAAALADSPALDRGLEGGISYAKETTDRLLRIARLIQLWGFALISLLLVAAVLLIGNTIRLSIFARRREVEVMRLVGATNWFIRWPFVIEGIICGIAGAVVAVVLIWIAKITVVDEFIRNTTSGFARDQASSLGFAWLCLILVGAGGAVGALGSGITLRRFLRV
ncbi:MAG: permease-like cell division protein FtsX [Thermoleophilia bacterium]